MGEQPDPDLPPRPVGPPTKILPAQIDAQVDSITGHAAAAAAAGVEGPPGLRLMSLIVTKGL